MNAPGADAPQELQFRLSVDEAHCDRAAQGLRVMAQYQYLSRVKRYEGIGWLTRFQQRTRKVAPTIAALVFVAGLIVIWVGCVDKSVRHVYFVLAAILLLEALALWLLPRRADRIGASLRDRFARSFGNRAADRMDKTRRAVPFQAVYDLRGDLLAYMRIEKGQGTLGWHRNLGKLRQRGVALQTPGLLAIFSKPGRVFPALIVLTTEDGGMAAAIRALGWTIVALDPASGDPLAPAAVDSSGGDTRAADLPPSAGPMSDCSMNPRAP